MEKQLRSGKGSSLPCGNAYDAWGNILSMTGPMAYTNPIRYRGYYYDDETGWYWLQTRYYNPTWCRFINADCMFIAGEDALNAANMYTYCNNNPVMFVDPSGLAPTAFDLFLAYFADPAQFGKLVMALLRSVVISGIISLFSPSDYVRVKGGATKNDSPNCYAYVLGLSYQCDPGTGFSKTKAGRRYYNGLGVDDLVADVLSDLHGVGINAVEIGNFDYKNPPVMSSGQYIISLRVNPDNGDYHFLLRHSNGLWSDKHGFESNSVLNFLSKNAERLWTHFFFNTNRKYNSETRYILVG